MPRTVFEVDVNDEKFKKFLELFKDYQAQLGKMSGFWAASSDAAAGAETSSLSMVDSLAAVAASAVLISDALQHTEAASGRATNNFGRLADHAKGIASSLLSATVSLAKWSVLSLGAGLIGGGVGLYGLDRLGESVAATRRTSQGLGISAGELQAFNVNYGQRLGLGTDFLNTVQGAQADLGQQWKFSALGIPQSEVGGDTANLTTDVIRRAHTLWQQAGPGGHNIQWMNAHGLEGVMGLNQWQAIGRQSEGDLDKWGAEYRHDANSMNVADPTQKAWVEFTTQLERAGKQIEKVFVTALQPLIDSGALQKLSGAVEHLIEKFFANQNVIKWVDDFAKLISQTGDYLGSAKFQNDMKTFIDDIGYAAEKMVGVLRFLHLLPSGDAPPGGAGPRQFNASDPMLPGAYGPVTNWHDLFGFKGSLNFSQIEKTHGLPTGLLNAVGWEESHLNADIKDSPAGAQGMFQFMPGTQKDYGITDPHNVKQESNAAGAYLEDLLRKYQGDLEKALAGYNWGPQNLDKDVAAHGADWKRFAPNETRKYIQDIIGNTPGSPVHVQVQIINQGGAPISAVVNAVRQ